MNKNVVLFCAALVLLLSCSREVDQVIQPGETITFTAGWARAEDTRTILQPNGTSVWWEPSAQINVFFGNKASGRFTSTNSQAQAVVDFRGSLPIVVGSVETENPAHAYWAVYPYDSANTCNGESVTLNIPSTQTAAEGTFANKMFPSIATSTNFYLAFYNICGGVRFTVSNEGISSVTFKANNGESLVGKAQVGFDGVPVVKKVTEGSTEITVNAPEEGFIPGKEYFAAILPQTVSKGVTLTFKKANGTVATTSIDNAIIINRTRFGTMTEKDRGLVFEGDGSGYDPSDFCANNIILYTSTDGNIVNPYKKNAFGAVIVSNEYVDGRGIITFDADVTRIGDSAFWGVRRLSSITIPGSVTSIGTLAFHQCSDLSSVILSEGLIDIGQQAFLNCGLTSITIPESVTSIGGGAFNACYNLSSISIPENSFLSEIGNNAFGDCYRLNSISIPNGVSSIGGGAFAGCSSLTSLTIPKGVTSIQWNTFKGCSSLTSISIPEGVTSIGGDAFSGCSSLISVNIPEGVTSIGEGAFRYCSGLANINIPDNVTVIGDFAFERCENLYSINIPDNESFNCISFAIFRGCSSLTSISIPEGVTSIGGDAFSGCSSLTSVNIPEGVTSIGGGAFRGCKNLTSVFVLPITPPLGENGMFGYDGEGDDYPIYVPSSSVREYKMADYWCNYVNRIKAIPE